jgi:asparagine synthase (glutamine-hydrolysing)
MCGIGGFQGQFDRDLLERMNAIMAYRGPDDSGVYYNPESCTGLAHRRLSIIDLSTSGHQPMWDITNTCAITFNGEIYNYHELRKSLSKDGFSFHSQTDTEVLLNLYLRDGYDMLRNLNGIFAFTIHDSRAGTLFVVRDGFGVKPLYYTHTPKGFLFASELKALLLEPSVTREIDPTAIHYYLSYLWAPAPQTMLAKVKKLEPGATLIVKAGEIVKHGRFYNIPVARGDESMPFDEAVTQVRQSFEVAVERQMVADVPVGAFLSGGLDSSSICAVARKYCSAGQKLQCFTIDTGSSDEGFASDLPYAKSVARHLGVELHIMPVHQDGMQNLEKLIYHLDEPEADPAAINVMFIASLAREHNIKVLLSGTGADDIFGGYRRHLAVTLQKHWARLPAGTRLFLYNIIAKAPLQIPLLRRLKKFLQSGAMNGNNRIAGYFHWIDPSHENMLYGEWMRRHLADEPFSAPLMKSLDELAPEVPDLHRMLYLDQKHFLIDHNLNYTDKASMSVGVETRVPFLDRDLVALAAGLPPNMKQRGRIGKYVLKKAMVADLPSEVINRPKTGFGVPLRGWIKNDMSALINEYLGNESIRYRGIFDPKGVRRLINLDKAGHIDAAYTILALICIEMWMRMFVDKPITP